MHEASYSVDVNFATLPTMWYQWKSQLCKPKKFHKSVVTVAETSVFPCFSNLGRDSIPCKWLFTKQ